MYLTRKDPSLSLPSLQTLQSSMNRLFEDTLEDFLGSERQRTSSWAPAVEIYETKGELVIVAELPGFEKKEIDISFEDGRLTISGERKSEEKKDRTFYRNERWYGRFERTFQLSGSVDHQKIKANLKDGILSISVPKKEEAKAKQIPVSID